MGKLIVRQVPRVFRLVGALLLTSLVAGQLWWREPAGAATRRLLAIIERHCSAAARRIAAPTVADGARAIDRMALRVIAGQLDGLWSRPPLEACLPS